MSMFAIAEDCLRVRFFVRVMAFQNVRRGSGDVCRTFLKWASCIHSFIFIAIAIVTVILIVIVRCTAELRLERSVSSFIHGGKYLKVVKLSPNLWIWEWLDFEMIFQIFVYVFFTLKLYCLQAEIVRKKGKSLLNDPLFNKVLSHIKTGTKPVWTVPKICPGQWSMPQITKKLWNAIFRGWHILNQRGIAWQSEVFGRNQPKFILIAKKRYLAQTSQDD